MPARKRNTRGEGSRLRQEIEAAGLELLRDTGTEAAVTVRAIARRTGMAPQSFYLHFASTAELLHELYRQQYVLVVDAVQRRVATAASDPARRLRAACEAYLAFGREHPAEYYLLFGTRGGTPEWPEGRPGEELIQEFRALLVEAGASRPDIALALLWASLHGLVSLVRDRPAFAWPAEDKLLDQLLAPWDSPDTT